MLDLMTDWAVIIIRSTICIPVSFLYYLIFVTLIAKWFGFITCEM